MFGWSRRLGSLTPEPFFIAVVVYIGEAMLLVDLLNNPLLQGVHMSSEVYKRGSVLMQDRHQGVDSVYRVR